MQAEPVKYLHAGMIQHDPSGNPAFLHRTAEGKVYPFNHGYRKVGNILTPLPQYSTWHGSHRVSARVHYMQAFHLTASPGRPGSDATTAVAGALLDSGAELQQVCR